MAFWGSQRYSPKPSLLRCKGEKKFHYYKQWNHSIIFQLTEWSTKCVPWSLSLALERISRPLIVLHISAVGGQGLGDLKLKDSLPDGREAAPVHPHGRGLGCVGRSGWSASLSISESLLLSLGIEPLIWPIRSRKDQVSISYLSFKCWLKSCIKLSNALQSPALISKDLCRLGVPLHPKEKENYSGAWGQWGSILIQTVAHWIAFWV